MLISICYNRELSNLQDEYLSSLSHDKFIACFNNLKHVVKDYDFTHLSY